MNQKKSNQKLEIDPGLEFLNKALVFSLAGFLKLPAELPEAVASDMLIYLHHLKRRLAPGKQAFIDCLYQEGPALLRFLNYVDPDYIVAYRVYVMKIVKIVCERTNYWE